MSEENKTTVTATDNAENQTSQESNTEIKTPVVQTAQEPIVKERTFSEKEFNHMALKQYSAGIINAMKEAGFTDVDENNFKKNLSSFKKWTDDQKTSEQLARDAEAAAKQEAAAAQAELSKYKQSDALRKAGVQEDFIGYVGYEVSRMAESTNVEFESAMQEFLSANTSYLNTPTAQTPTSQETEQQKETRTVTATTTAGVQEETKQDMQLNFWGVRPRPN